MADKTDLDILMDRCNENIDLDKTIGFARTDLNEEQELIEKLGEKVGRQNKLLAKLVDRQNRDDRSANFVRILNKCTSRVGLAICAGMLGAITYFTTVYIKATLEKTPAEIRQERMIMELLEDYKSDKAP